jgi:hypothetical protein
MTQDTVGWSVIRTATEEDRRRLQQAAYRFCRRHHFGASALDRSGRAHGMPDFAALVDEEITLLMGHDQPPHVRAYGKRMRRLWRPRKVPFTPHVFGWGWSLNLYEVLRRARLVARR